METPFKIGDRIMPSDSELEKLRQKMIQYNPGSPPYNLRKDWLTKKQNERAVVTDCKPNKYSPMVVYGKGDSPCFTGTFESMPCHWQLAKD